MLDTTSKDALRVLFSTRGSFVQSLLVEELVSAVDVLSREALNEVTRRVMGSVAAATERRAREALGPLRAFVIPLPTPFEVISRCGVAGCMCAGCMWERNGIVTTRARTQNTQLPQAKHHHHPPHVYSLAPVVELTDDDREALDTIREAVALFEQLLASAAGAPGSEPGPLAPASLSQLRQAARELQPLLPELLPGIAYTGELFVRALLRRVLLRLADEVGPAQRGVVQGVVDGVMAAMPLSTQVEVLTSAFAMMDAGRGYQRR